MTIKLLFSHLKHILHLDRLRLRGPFGTRDEFLLAATAQNRRKLAGIPISMLDVNRPPIAPIASSATVESGQTEALLKDPNGTISDGWHFASADDFGGNGKSDILWVNDNGKASIWSTFLKAPAISERQ